MSMNRKNVLLAALVAAAISTLSACASSEIAATPANVVVAASKSPQLTTFTKMVQQAGLTATLEGPGPVTVFAPSDEAFQAVPPATLEKWAKDGSLLKNVLSYHVVPGLVKSADIQGAKPMVTVQGGKIALSRAGDFVTADDGLVIAADIAAGNGVIHVIDRVLTPPKQ